MLGKRIYIVGVLIFIALAFYALLGRPLHAPPSFVLPPLTRETKEKLEKNPAFQYAISYDNGFSPRELHVRTGETVRFTNNSKKNIWIAALGEDGKALYPGKGTCGGSRFDSCGIIVPLDFWEFRFTKIGSWQYQNIGHPEESGMVHVE